ncbi:MAG: hypothetical protein V1754_12155 [Pseudomonadota bacterium]
MALLLNIEELHSAPESGKINQEWVVLTNEGDNAFNTEGCSITVARGTGARAKVVTTLKAGLVIQAKEKVRLVSGSMGRKSQGEPPVEENMRNVHLFLKTAYLDKAGLVIRLVKGQMELCQAVYEPSPKK